MIEDCHAMVSSAILSLRFQFCEESLYAKEEVFDNVIGSVTHAVGMTPSINNLGSFRLLKSSESTSCMEFLSLSQLDQLNLSPLVCPL